jgi:uncharacterized protein YuzE
MLAISIQSRAVSAFTDMQSVCLTGSFDHASYDAQGDVLYLHVGEPQAAADSEETPEQHVVRFDENGAAIGLTILGAKWLLDRDGAIAVTLPELQRVDAEELEPALRAA